MTATSEYAHCFEWIKSNKFQKIGLQIPDSMLESSCEVFNAFDAHFEGAVDLSICADATNNSCCLDYTNANHYYIDAIVHFGSACLSRCVSIAHYYFVEQVEPVAGECDRLIDRLLDEGHHEAKFLIAYDLEYSKVASTCHALLAEKAKECELMQIPSSVVSNIPSECTTEVTDDSFLFCNRVFGTNYQKFDEYTIVFFGSLQSELLANIYMLYGDAQIPVINVLHSKTLHIESTVKGFDTHFHGKFLSLAEKIRKAKLFGLIVTPFVYEQYPEVADRARRLLKRLHKQFYEITVHRLDEGKLDTFPEVDMYVYVACPFTVSRVRYKQFYQDVVSVPNLEYALNECFSWDALRLNNDLNLLAPGRSMHSKLPEDPVPAHVQNSTELVEKSFYESLPLNQKTWKGLEPNLGHNVPAKVTQGMTGVASGYVGEKS